MKTEDIVRMIGHLAETDHLNGMEEYCGQNRGKKILPRLGIPVVYHGDAKAARQLYTAARWFARMKRE